MADRLGNISCMEICCPFYFKERIGDFMEKKQTLDLRQLLSENTYPGRGIVVGKSEDGKKAVAAYFIMGRSENSRNRVFEENEGGITIYPFDASKVSDPSLIIYNPVRTIGQDLIVTNGDQTDTVYDFIAQGKTFEEALDTRCFEPDAPNYTPRISAVLNFAGQDFTYKMSILKSADSEGTACNRFTFSYAPLPGVAHFIHTYQCDGNPIPSFEGEPEPVSIGNNAEEIAELIWNHLNAENKVSLYVLTKDLSSGEIATKIINKNVK